MKEKDEEEKAFKYYRGFNLLELVGLDYPPGCNIDAALSEQCVN
jgi:hypothetical protein